MAFEFEDKFGTAGSGDGEFSFPWSCASDDTNLYVTDAFNHRIQIFNKSTKAFVGKIGGPSFGSGDGEFNDPRGVAVDANYIYVADTWNHRVQVFNKTSPFAFVAKFGTNGSADAEFNQPVSISLDATKIYIMDKANNYVKVWTKGTYSYSSKVGTAGPGSGDGQFDSAWGVYVFDGKIYVCDTNNSRVQVFNVSGGSFLGKFGSAGSTDGKFNFNTNLLVDANYIYVADASNDRVQTFNVTSPYAFVEKFGIAGSGDGQFDTLTGIAGDSTKLFLVDNGNTRIQIFSGGAPPADPTNLGASCSIWSPASPTFTSAKDRETIDKVEGLLTVENGNTTVTGFGTKFTEDLVVGSKIVLNSVVYIVDSITNDTELELTAAYAGADDYRIEAWIPVTVSFTNTTIITGAATYFWDFGDGTYSTLESPTHTYSDGGTYEPTLKVYPMPAITGTIELVNGSATVEGSGTSFTTELVAGESLIINGVNYTIQSITDNDTLVLTEVYDGVSEVGIQAIKRTDKLTGTISVINNSVTVTGSGTSFTTQLVRGDAIVIAGVSYIVDEVVSNTELKLMNPYDGATASGLDVFKKESRFDGAYGSTSQGQAVVIPGKGPIDIDYLHGDFEISLLELTQLTGTLAVTNNSIAILGSGTSFTTELTAGEQIVIEGVIYTIYSITDDTHMTLTAVYAGATDTGLNYYQKSDKMTGTVNVTNGDKKVVGVATTFIADYAIGDTITLAGVDYLIDDIVNDLELTLSAVYAGSTDTGLNHYKGSSSYTNMETGPFMLNFLDGTLGEVTEYLWDFGNGALTLKTGTLAVTQGSNVVTGTGTLFTSELAEGNKIEIDGVLYKVLNILSDTELVLASYYAGEDASGLSYKLKGVGTTSSLANPGFYFETAGTYEITLEVVKGSTVYTTTKTIQVKGSPSSAEEPLSDFGTSKGDGAELISGSLGVRQGETLVLGSGTSFTTDLTEGGGITIEGVTYEIESIVNDEELVLTTPYQGGTTTSVALVGNLSVISGSNVVTGSGTSFTTDLSANQTITLAGVDYVVLEIVSDSELKLTYDYAGDTDTALSGTKEEGVLSQGIAGYNGFTGLSELAGTISVTKGNPKVIGLGTSFTTELVKNDELVIEGVPYTILGILSDTELVLFKAYAGESDSGLLYFLNSKSAPTTDAVQFNNFTNPVEETETGTISVINGSVVVTGSGTLFTTELIEGQRLNIEGTLYTIGLILSDTSLELTEVYAGATAGGLTLVAELAETYFWDFGDGTFSTEKDPAHIYSESGSFEAKLTVTTKNGTTTYSQTIESVAIDLYAIDTANDRVGLFSFGSTGNPKLIRAVGRFGNGRGQFNGLNDLIIVGKGKKTLQGMEV